MRNQLQVLGLWMGLSLLAACGKTSDIAWVKLDIGVATEQGRKAIDLMSDLSSLSQFEAAHLKRASCKQQNLVAAVQLEGDNKQLFSYPIEITSTAATPTDAATVTSLFSTAILEKPIEFGVPKGANFEFAVLGFFVEPVDNNGDGVCDRTTNNQLPSGSNESTTYSAIGHGKATVDDNTVLTVDVWTIRASPTADPDPTFGSPTCISGTDTCPKKDFFKLSKTHGTLSQVRVEYLFANNRPFRLVQNFKASQFGTPNVVYLPHLFPVVVTYTLSGGIYSQKFESTTAAAPSNTDPNFAFHAMSL